MTDKTETEAEREAREARELDADFERLFSGAFGQPQRRLWMILDGGKVQERWTRQQLVTMAKGRPASQGKVDGHPFLAVDPNLSAGQVQQLLGQSSLTVGGPRLSVTEGLSVGKKMAALAIKQVGGDWSLYARPLPDWALKTLDRWSEADLDSRVDVLDQLDQQTMLTLTTLVSPPKDGAPKVPHLDWTSEAGN